MNPTSPKGMLAFLEKVRADIRDGKPVGMYTRNHGKGQIEVQFERGEEAGHLDGWMRHREKKFQLFVIDRTLRMLRSDGSAARRAPKKESEGRYVPVATRLRQMYPTFEGKGSVWTVSGGLPSLGKRR